MKRILPALLLASACSVTQETKPVEVELDDDIAKTQASALSSAVASAESHDGIAIAEALESVGDIAAALAPPTKNGGRRRLLRSTTTCSCTVETQSCTFDGCVIGNATVSGALSWSRGEIRCEALSFDVAATSEAIGAAKVSLDCALTYSSGRLAGTVTTKGHATVEDVAYTWSASLAVNDLTFTKTAFTGGSVGVSASVSDGERAYEASAIVALP